MSALAARARRAIRHIEASRSLDAPGAMLETAVSRVTRDDRVKGILSGTPLGHRLHPALTDVPIGCWASATIVDLVGGPGGRAAARRLVALGVLAALPTALTGASDWEDSEPASRRVGLVHAAANTAGLVLQAASWSARRRGRTVRGALLSGAALGAVAAGGYLGGHLVFASRAGVDVPVPVARGHGWHPACRVDELVDGEPVRAEVDGARVVVVRDRGHVYALAAVCSHAGGPLEDGEVAAGAIRCPWHGSRFRLDGGGVERGPATAPQPSYDVRVRGEVVEVRPAVADGA